MHVIIVNNATNKYDVFLRDSAHTLLPIPQLEYKMSAQPHYEIQTADGQYT
jgi:hypothetical protein